MGFVRCPPATALQPFGTCRASSLAVFAAADDSDMNFMVGHDLRNAAYIQWLMNILSEEQWTRMFGTVPGMNEERAGDAAEVCLLNFDFTTLCPYEFRRFGDPRGNYAGFECSLRSLAGHTSTKSIAEKCTTSITITGGLRGGRNDRFVLGPPNRCDHSFLMTTDYNTALKLTRRGLLCRQTLRWSRRMRF